MVKSGKMCIRDRLKVHRGTVTVNSANVTKLGDSIDIQNNSTLAFARDFSYGGVISGCLLYTSCQLVPEAGHGGRHNAHRAGRPRRFRIL